MGIAKPDAKCSWKLVKRSGQDFLVFTKLGNLLVVVHRPLEGKAGTATITRDGDQWFVSIVCEVEVADPKPPLGEPVGIDRGVANLVADSTGHLELRPAFLDKAEAKIAKASRNVSQKKKGSKNRAKAREKLAAVYRQVRRQRENVPRSCAWPQPIRAKRAPPAVTSTPRVVAQDRFVCTVCQHEDHADTNAACVLRQRYEEINPRRTGGEEVCGGDGVARLTKQKPKAVRSRTLRKVGAKSVGLQAGDGLPTLHDVAGQQLEKETRIRSPPYPSGK